MGRVSLLDDRLNNIQASVAIKAPVRVATTGDIILSGLQTVDGVSLNAFDRVLVKDQYDQTTNGIYLVQDTDWVRDNDFNGTRDIVRGTQCPVDSGSAWTNSIWKVVGTNPISIGQDPITFVRMLRLAEQQSLVTCRDYGAVGDGVNDDTEAIQAALTDSATVYIPPGTYRTTAPLILYEGQEIYGAGYSSIIQPDNNTFDAFQILGDYNLMHGLCIRGGLAAVRLGPGSAFVVVQNNLYDLFIYGPQYGLVLDGGTDPNFPCYWNSFTRVIIEFPVVHGVWLTQSGAGDTPNANKFHNVRVYSHGASQLNGNGFWIEYGRFNNSFFDCEANLHSDAHACFFADDGADTNILMNCYCESQGAIYNFLMSAGSQNTMIFNGITASAGRAIEDLSGGKYTAINTGFPFKNWMDKTNITDVTLNTVYYNTRFYSGETDVTLDPTINYHLISAFAGDVSVVLPNAVDAEGLEITIIKSDNSAFTITISEDGGGTGPNGSDWLLVAEYDSVTLLSNGAHWWVKSTNKPYDSIDFYDSAGTFVPDLAKDVYLVSAFGGDTVVQLPAASTAGGRQFTIKRTDSSSNSLIVNLSGGGGPDGRSFPLSNIYDFVRVISNNANWWVTGTNCLPIQNVLYSADATLDMNTEIVFVSAFSGAVTITLPLPNTDYVVGKRVLIKKTDSSSNHVTIQVVDGSNIDDVSSLTLSAYGNTYEVYSNGSQYFVLTQR